MNADNLKIGNEITQRLKLLAEQKEKYETAETYWDANFSVRQKDKTNTQICGLQNEVVDFKLVRALALQKIADETAALEKEFQTL